jgi:hypothetical protein
VIAVLIAIESTRGTLISATLAIGEREELQKRFSSARASRLHSQLLLSLECVDNERN